MGQGRVFGLGWNRTEPFLRSEPGPLAGHPHPLLTLILADTRFNKFILAYINCISSCLDSCKLVPALTNLYLGVPFRTSPNQFLLYELVS